MIQLTQIELKNFRAFNHCVLSFDEPIVLIEGCNGIGKTSLLEALHYLCFARSFRTHRAQELVCFGAEGFFIKAQFANAPYEEIQAGFAHKKKLVKIDTKTIGSVKELLQYYRVVTVTEDDMALITQGPENRRRFIDQCAVLYTPEILDRLRTYRHILDNRNALLHAPTPCRDTWLVWTEQLWHATQEIQAIRTSVLAMLTASMQGLAQEFFPGYPSITGNYDSKRPLEKSFNEFITQQWRLYDEERRMKRSLFGAHVDDIVIALGGQPARLYASRGQQKLLIMLAHVAHIKNLVQQESGIRPLVLLDDLMADFDEERLGLLIDILVKLGVQLIITSPLSESPLRQRLLRHGAQTVKLTA